MKINKLLLTIAISLLSLSASSQSRSSELIKSNYPQVYSSIIKNAEKQWANDPKTKQAIIEGQSQAFLNVVKDKNSIGNDLLREAIITNSLPGYKDSNISVINEYSTENALPLVQCDWYKVQAYCKKNKNAATTQASTNTATNNNLATPTLATEVESSKQTIITEEGFDAPAQEIEQPVYTRKESRYQSNKTEEARVIPNREPEQPVYPQRESQYERTVREEASAQAPERRRSTYPTKDDQNQTKAQSPLSETTPKSRAYSRYQESRQQENAKYFARESKNYEFNIGAKIAAGQVGMYNLGNYTNSSITAEGTVVGNKVPNNLQVKSVFGFSAEGGIVLDYKTRGFLIQNETTIQYMQAKFKNRIYSSAGKYNEKPIYNNKYVYIQTAFHFGGYLEIGEDTDFVFGVGPYVALRLSSSYDKYGIFGNEASKAGLYEHYMKNGQKNINFGLTGMIGLDINESRIALYPTVGLTKMQDKEDYKPYGISFGFTYFFY